MYVVYHGPKGLKYIANNIHQKASQLNANLNDLGVIQKNNHFFDTLQIEIDAKAVKNIAESKKLNFYYPDDHTVCISINETSSTDDIEEITSVFAQFLNQESSSIEGQAERQLPGSREKK